MDLRNAVRRNVWPEQLYPARFEDGFSAYKVPTTSRLAEYDIQSIVAFLIHRVRMRGYFCSWLESQDIEIEWEQERVHEEQHLFVAGVLPAGFPAKQVLHVA